MDVHKENYTLCCYSFDRDTVEYRQTVPSDYRLILKYLEQVRRKYPEEVEFICGYEAGCLGYSLYHQLTDHGVKCIILAPTTMGITNTNRVKTDRKDAATLSNPRITEWPMPGNCYTEALPSRLKKYFVILFLLLTRGHFITASTAAVRTHRKNERFSLASELLILLLGKPHTPLMSKLKILPELFGKVLACIRFDDYNYTVIS